MLILTLAWLASGMRAQRSNILRIPDAVVQIGEAQLPITIENTDELVAAQFDITLPEGVTTKTTGSTGAPGNSGIAPTVRAAGHTVIVRSMGGTRYRVMLFSNENQPILGNTGTILNLPITIPDTFEAGTEHAVTLTNASLTLSTGENVLTGTQDGKLIVDQLPDLTPAELSCVGGDLQSPTTLTPGGQLTVSWKVKNVGGQAATGGWSEKIVLVNALGTVQKLLTTVYYTQELASGAEVSRQAEITLPTLIGIGGTAYLQVVVVPDSGTGEAASAQGNNTLQSDTELTVERLLFVELSAATIVEGSTSRISVKVSRSGDWSTEQTFNLQCSMFNVQSPDSRISIPATVTIRQGQSAASVYMTITDNDVIDYNSVITITASGNDYPAGTANVTIEDNEYPDLTLTASKSTMNEGESFTLTVSRPANSPTIVQDITVTIISEDSRRFAVGLERSEAFPTTVTIPAGETSVTINVTATDDEVPQLVLSNKFTAQAAKHNKAEVIVILNDNDLPVLELEIAPNIVSETDGPVAVTAVLRRKTHTNAKITVRLTDDADGGLYFGNRSFTLNKGVEEVRFNFGPVDNANVDGDRIYNITAAVWISSCSCGASGESAGYVTTQLQVLDNDGPALGLTSSATTVKEGGKATLTISRNTTDTTNPLVVTLNSDYEEGITYQHGVTIPAGQLSTTVEVTSSANDVQGDSHSVVFTVRAEGYATATCVLMITDQTLPDARISSITAATVLDGSPVEEQEVGTDVKLNIVVTNDGAAVLPAEVLVKVYRRGDGVPFASIYTDEPIAIGGSLTLTRTVTLPLVTGTYSYYAVVNDGDNKVQELSYNNNTSRDVSVKAISPFTVTVGTDKTVYNQGEKVIFSGQVTGNGAANASLDLYVIFKGTRQVQDVTTDAQGRFTYEWTMAERQMGHFDVGACYPGEGLRTVMSSFDVYGLSKASYSNITCDVICGDTYNGYFNVINPSSLPLTNVQVQLLEVPATCEATMNMPSTIAGGATARVSYSLKALTPTEGNSWEEVKARITTAEGVTLDQTIYFYSRTATGKLVASTRNIVTTMIKGQSREYSIEVTNQGRGNTGKISLALPDFIKSLAGNSLPALEQNETLTIALSLTPTDEMQLNVPVTGQLGINCENGDGTSVSFNITPVSESTGTLVVDVTDENTYYTEEAPHVAGAEIVVRNPVTNALVTQGVTGQDGKFSVELTEGYYKLSVTADKHDSYTNNIYVDPGVETVETISLSINAISVTWNVVETEVEDEYEIVTTVSYETNVPVPVVVMNAPDRIDGDNMQEGESVLINVLLTNKGLITAKEVELGLPTDLEEFSFTPMASTYVGDLPPQQTITIPVVITKLTQEEAGARRAQPRKSPAPSAVTKDCFGYFGTLYKWICGNDMKSNTSVHRMALKTCATATIYSAVFEALTGGGGGLFEGWASHGGSGKPSDPNPSVNLVFHDNTDLQNMNTEAKPMCNPEISARVEGTVSGLIGFIPTNGLYLSSIDWGANAGYEKYTQGYVSKETWAGLFWIAASGYAGKIKNDAIMPDAKMLAPQSVGDAAGTCVGLASMIAPDHMPDFTVFEKYLPSHIKATLDKVDYSVEVFNYQTRKYPSPVRWVLKEYLEWKRGYELLSRSNNAPRRTASWIQAYDAVAERYCDELYAYEFMMLNVFDDPVWYYTDDDEMKAFFTHLATIPSDHGPLTVEELLPYKPGCVSNTQFETLINRINDPSSIDFEALNNATAEMATIENDAKADGYETMTDKFSAAYTAYEEQLEGTSSVCSTVKLEIKQTMTMTRQAFRGTLTVTNNDETAAMENIRLTLNVTNLTTGQVATSHEFQINGESLEGFTGDVALGSSWHLNANSSGTATILFIPTKYAAPEEPVDWAFGGTLTYDDPSTGLEVTRELYPVTLTVKPSPELDLTYFMQRDVYGDDPLTLDVVEPMKPAEFALLINNKGYGDATNVRMQTEQPRIIENEKGLYIDFEIISSQVNGGDAALSFGQTIANDFGTIPAHSQMYAQWWLTSTLLGHFTEYNVQASHITSYGNPDLSLLDQVTIHELIHGFDLPGSVDVSSATESGGTPAFPQRAFLVNDVIDANDTPDRLYFTNGETADVITALSATIERTSQTTCVLTITPTLTGWNYGSILDPTHGYAELKSIVRQSDGAELGSSRFWQTDRTLRDGKDWLYEHRLHFVDEFADGNPVTYILTFDPMPETVLEVRTIGPVPAEGQIAEADIETLTVDFNKEIDAATFTGDDITFAVQGVKQNASQIGISTEDNKSFTLNMRTLNATLPNGYYTLTVQTADITDAEGFKGKEGKQTSWILFRGGLVQLLTSTWPLNSGNIAMETIDAGARSSSPALGARASRPHFTPVDNSARYGSTVKFTATPEEGYEFANWTLNGEVVGTDPTYTTKTLSDMNVVANFTPKTYRVEVAAANGQGSIVGAGTGIYEFGKELKLTATPAAGFYLKEWRVNDALAGTDNELTFTVSGAMTVAPVFGILGDANDDNQVTTFDVTKAVNFILTGDADGIIMKAIDMDRSNTVTTFDVTKIVERILNK